MNSKCKTPRAVVMAAALFVTLTTLSVTAQSWTNRYVGPKNFDYGRAIAVAGNGNVYVTGDSSGIGSDYDYATIAYTGEGVALWTNRYNGPAYGTDYVRDIAVDGAGNVYVTGCSEAFGNTDDYLTIKYSSAGTPLWTNRYSGSGLANDEASAIAVDDGGNVYVTGWSGSSDWDYLTIAHSSGGVPLWTNRYDGPAVSNSGDWAQDIAVDNGGNVYVTGFSAGISSDIYNAWDYLTIAYSSAGVQPIPLQIERVADQVVLSWTDDAFQLQSAPVVTGPFTNIPAATSPYTNPITGARQFFRAIAP